MDALPRRAKAYISGLSLGSVAILIWALYCFANELLYSSADISERLVTIAFLIILSTACRMMPVMLNEDQALDVSTIITFMSMLVMGAPATIIVVMVSYLLCVETHHGKKVHVFNRSIEKTAFNLANLVLSVFGGWCVAYLAGLEPQVMNMPGVLLPAICFVLVNFFINTLLMSILMMMLTDTRIDHFWRRMYLELIPNVLTTAPLGFLLAVMYQMENGIYLVMLLFLPLLSARLAFKLRQDAKEQRYSIVSTLTNAIEARDEYTKGHSSRVANIAQGIAQQMGIGYMQQQDIKLAGILHDIGKIGIMDSILCKNGYLDDNERAVIEKHPAIGMRILNDVELANNIKEFILCHHERYDGKGYPRGLGGTDVPIEAYILAVADAFDAMTSDRPYRKAFPVDKAAGILIECAGTQLHPDVVVAALQMFEAQKLISSELCSRSHQFIEQQAILSMKIS